MARSADELPREGFDTQQFIENMSERVGANNTIDVIMRNLPRIARQVGAKPPAYHPTHMELNMVKPMSAKAPPAPQKQQPPQNAAIPPSNVPPKIDDMPDTPRGLHTPRARMMPGADTEPGKPLSEKDVAAFNRSVAEMNASKPTPPIQIGNNPWEEIPSQFRNAMAIPVPVQNSYVEQKPVFFKDGLGNEYKTIGDRLYVLGWQDANVKVRLINESTGKEIPTNGRKFQIYGWHLVQRMNESESTKAEDITKIENETTADEPQNKDISPKKVDIVETLSEKDSEPSEDKSKTAVGTQNDSAESVNNGGDAKKSMEQEIGEVNVSSKDESSNPTEKTSAAKKTSDNGSKKLSRKRLI